MRDTRVMIVDDSELDREMLEAVLKRRGFEVVALADGARCLEEIEKHEPDVVLLDIVMPQMQGKEILHLIRKKYTTIQLPVIMVTMRTDPSEIVETLVLGANDFITKPVDFDVAVLRIGTHAKIVELSKNMMRLKEIEAVNAMIATYNHELNNPLAVALAELKTIQVLSGTPKSESLIRTENALWRIADIVKRIDQVTRSESVDFSQYADETRMVNIRKKEKSRT